MRRARRARFADRGGIKNGVGPVEVPTPPDIAPTGELAGLPVRDFLNLSAFASVIPRGQLHTAKNWDARTRYFVGVHPIFFT